jgi:hypothetical protein
MLLAENTGIKVECTRRLGGGRMLLDENASIKVVCAAAEEVPVCLVWISYGHLCTYILYIILDCMRTISNLC